MFNNRSFFISLFWKRRKAHFDTRPNPLLSTNGTEEIKLRQRRKETKKLFCIVRIKNHSKQLNCFGLGIQRDTSEMVFFLFILLFYSSLSVFLSFLQEILFDFFFYLPVTQPRKHFLICFVFVDFCFLLVTNYFVFPIPLFKSLSPLLPFLSPICFLRALENI